MNKKGHTAVAPPPLMPTGVAQKRSLILFKLSHPSQVLDLISVSRFN